MQLQAGKIESPKVSTCFYFYSHIFSQHLHFRTKSEKVEIILIINHNNNNESVIEKSQIIDNNHFA